MNTSLKKKDNVVPMGATLLTVFVKSITIRLIKIKRKIKSKSLDIKVSK